MRKFSLKNGLGEVKNLTSQKVFLNAPSNLGFKKNLSVSRHGFSSIAMAEDYSLPQPSAEFVFTGTNSDRYEAYSDLVRFLMAKPLVLTYELASGESYTLDCDVTELTKTESSNGVMVCGVVFSGLSMWKGQTSHYEFTSTVTVANNGDVPCGIDITAVGSMENPTIKFMKEGSLYGEARFLGTFTSLHLNTKDGEEMIEVKNGDSILPNPLGYQDLSISNGSIFVTFVKLARGATTITFEADGGFSGTVSADVRPFYISV